MKAQRAFLRNHEEFAEADRLGLKRPVNPETMYRDFYFKIEGIVDAFITTDDYISITHIGRTILLKNEKAVWNKIKSYLE